MYPSQYPSQLIRLLTPPVQDENGVPCPHVRWLIAARASWVAVLVLVVAAFAMGVPHQYAALYVQLSAYGEAMHGFSVDFLARYLVILDAIVLIGFTGTAVWVFLRKSRNWLGLFVSYALITFACSINSTANTGISFDSWWGILNFLLLVGGLILFLGFLYIFPDGQFYPRWTAWLLVAYVIFWATYFVAYSLAPDNTVLGTPLFQFITSLLWFGSGIHAQTVRRRTRSTPLELQQTKWVMFGLSLGFLGFIIGFGGPLLLEQTHWMTPPLILLVYTLESVAMLMVPLSIGLSILRFRLWDIDPLIHQTVIYGVLTVLMTLIYLLLVAVLQALFRAVTGQQSDVAIVVSTLVIATLIKPVSRWMQESVDRRFYRQRVDFRRAFEVFSREVRTIIDLPELMRVLVNRITELWSITFAAVILFDSSDATFRVSDSRPLSTDELAAIIPDKTALWRLKNGVSVNLPKNSLFSLLVPLMVPRTGKQDMVGVLALGPRLSGQVFSRADQGLLHVLADQVGTAIYVAQLIAEKQDEADRREEAEERLEAYRNSPLGRAETFAQGLQARPEVTLSALHRQVQKAGEDHNIALLIGSLPKILDSTKTGPSAALAEGFNYLYESQFTPELLLLGLRTLLAELEKPQAAAYQWSRETRAVYQLCLIALEVSSIAQLGQLMPVLKENEALCQDDTCDVADPASYQRIHFLNDLARTLIEFESVLEILHSYERVDTSQDKLVYLVSAAERLSRIDLMARSELGSADRTIVRRIAESWLSIVTGTMSELQTRAKLRFQLLTRHTWQDDIVALTLSLYNEGQGGALNIQVNLASAAEYTAMDEAAHVERLAPGEEVQIELRVRPRLSMGTDHFRARFMIQFADPSGDDQVENYADVVYLMTPDTDFRFIPNPYVVGTPLQVGSPLFFGRDDVVAFIRENLAAAHRNNLVLIGQRRTGKTSLLKQLPARLSDEYFVVYIDGQTLGLDPGLPNLFLSLATEISFALEDRGFPIEPPELEDFMDSPASRFEHHFLARVRELIGDRHLLILFDEFEELEAAVRRGNLDASIFSFLRHLIQHGDRISVIFCGTHRMEELASDYWNVLFNISLYKDIGFLEQQEAMRLIQEPVATFGMRYDDLALDKMWRVTAGHPYFLQLLCHSLVNRHNKTKRNYLTVADINAALEEILASGEAHFVYLWAESTPDERLVLSVFSRMTALSGSVKPVQVVDYLKERGIRTSRRAVSQALHHLALRDILQAGHDDGSHGDVYRWRLGLLGLWAEKYKSLSRVVDEVRG